MLIDKTACKRFVFFQKKIKKSRPGHNISNPKSELNPNRKTRSVSCPKYKKYLNGFCKVVQNISESDVLLTEPERVTRKTEKTEKYEKNIRRNQSECPK